MERPFPLVFADNMGPIIPPAFGGFSYVSKLVDQKTKWWEIFIKAKRNAIDTLSLYVGTLVISTGLRLERLWTDKIGKYTRPEYQ